MTGKAFVLSARLCRVDLCFFTFRKKENAKITRLLLTAGLPSLSNPLRCSARFFLSTATSVHLVLLHLRNRFEEQKTQATGLDIQVSCSNKSLQLLTTIRIVQTRLLSPAEIIEPTFPRAQKHLRILVVQRSHCSE